MISYGYQAVNQVGKPVKGSINASSMEEARKQISKMGLTLVSIEADGIFTRDINIEIGGYPKERDISIMCRQFVSMYRVGISIFYIFQLLQTQIQNKKLREAIISITSALEKGDKLSEAMERYPKIFSKVMVNMVAAGETSGKIDMSFERIADQLEKTSKVKGLLQKALIYPVIVLIVTVIVSIVMLVMVIPSYKNMFESLGTELPMITRTFIFISDLLINHAILIILCLTIVIFTIIRMIKTEKGQYFVDKWILKMPGIGNLVMKSESAKMARTLGNLLDAGVPIVIAVNLTAKAMKNIFFQNALKNVQERINVGMLLSEAIDESDVFLPLVSQMIHVGEEAGDIGQMLQKMADYFEEEVENAVQSVLSAIEPMIIIVLAFIVGGLVAACMAPMIKLYEVLDTL